MRLNTSNLSHPRIEWEIRAAMMRAVEISAKSGIAIGCVRNAAGDVIFTATHDRQAVPAFSFRAGQVDVTPQVLKVLRKQAEVANAQLRPR
jgi:hypothetical protein